MALHRICSRAARHSAAVCESEGCPRHLRRPSYRSWSIPCSGGRSEGPILRPARVALLTNRKDVLTAAHLFDARRPLPLHSCQGPWGWGTGRTSGMKGSFVSAAAAIRGQQDGRTTRGGLVFAVWGAERPFLAPATRPPVSDRASISSIYVCDILAGKIPRLK